MAISMTQVLENPSLVARQIAADPALPFISSARVAYRSRTRLEMRVQFEPWAAMAAKNYPTEKVRLGITADGDVTVFAMPGDRRDWEHKNPQEAGGGLCLYFPEDPEALVWAPERNTFEELLGIISRHLQAEEYRRRNGRWPWEDAPHGLAAREGPKSDLMKQLAGEAK